MDSAAELGIPRLFISCYKFSFCAENCVEQYKPHLSVNSDTELFLLPGLPNKIEMTRLHFPDIPDDFNQLIISNKEAER